ncbi:hypothetical protein GPECTOR_22g827 [Gonium pectorale]|uniref:Uncharacterized protein n=1 Tax=Gonium pectorale TaxID=33097 RepID=A0A150GHY2_GONPE|nr:hypothetical protein GPECTOR_22g827 [Gonium pectorale]|eukprot:KXZ49235.1 hypothetical protein GPECTOR_22g827 [Gonium pectorale]
MYIFAAAPVAKDEPARPSRQLRDKDPGPSLASSQPDEAPKPVVQPAGGRSRPGSQRNSSNGTGGLRTGDEIWQLNLALGRVAEQLADPEDAKPSRRRFKSPTLQEKLHKQWGGTYGEKLEKELAPMDMAELPPAPKYEPATFLDDDPGASDAEEVGPSATVRAAADPPAQPISAPQRPKAAGREPGDDEPQPGMKGAGSKRGVPGGGGKRGATKAAVAAPAPAKSVAGDAEDEEGDEERQQPGVEGDGIMGAGPSTRTTRNAAGPVHGADPGSDAADQQEHGDEVTEPQQQPSAVGGHARVRKSHLPPNVTFGTASMYKPSLATVPSSLDGVAEDAAGVDSAPGPAGNTAAPAATKRVWEAVATGEDKARQAKALRLEQQQAKDMEQMRQRITELEDKCKEQSEHVKQLQGDYKVAEKRAQQAEKNQERLKEQLDRQTAENLRLKEELASLKEENKQLKAKEAKNSKFIEDMKQQLNNYY